MRLQEMRCDNGGDDQTTSDRMRRIIMENE